MHFLLVPIMLAAVTAPVADGHSAAAESSLRVLSDRYLAEREHEDPVVLISSAGTAHRLAADRLLLTELRAIDRSALSNEARVDAAILGYAVQYEIWRHDDLQDWAWDIQRYLELSRDALSDLPGGSGSTARERLLGAAARFRRMPAFLGRIRLLVDPARVPPSHARLVAEQNRHLLDGMFDSLNPQAATLTPSERKVFDSAVRGLRLAVAQHQRWLDQVLVPAARGSFRLGPALYDAKVRFELGAALSRPQIQQRAFGAIADIRRRMYAIAQQLLAGRAGAPPLPNNPDQAQETRGIRAALTLMEDRHPSRQGFIAKVRSTLATTTAFVRGSRLVSVPESRIEIVDMPASMQGIVPAFYQSIGDRSVFAVSPIPAGWSAEKAEDYLRSHNDYYLENLTIHEAMPGHFLQSAHLRANTSSLRRALGSREFAEGWAVYAQQMMVDAGYMRSDQLFELAELQWRLGSVCNALLDIGVQTEGWTREQGLELLVETGFQKPSEAATKWERATLTSTQLLTYFVGYSEHVELRDAVRRREGDAFDLRTYNDEVLSHGMPPVRLLRALMLDEPVQ